MTMTEARFWDRWANRYANKPVSNQSAYEKKLAKTKEYLTPESNVLEFGCGTGSTALAHAPYAGQVLATDYSAKMIEIAQQKAHARNIHNIRFKQANAEQVLNQSDFDLVMAHSLLHLIENRDALIRNTFQVLKPGGWFVQNTPCLGDHKAFLSAIFPLARVLKLVPRINVFKKRELLESLSYAGFILEYEWQPDPDTVFIIARKPVNPRLK